jgi:hypothetical protein
LRLLRASERILLPSKGMWRAFILLLVLAGSAQAEDAAALRARHAALKGQLANNPFGQPLHVESSASGGAHKGQIYAVLERPYRVVAPALARPEDWCQILTLQVNIKRCRADQSGQALAAFITRKARDAIASAHRVEFRYEPTTTSGDYLRVALSASSGPTRWRARRGRAKRDALLPGGRSLP